MNVIIVYAVVRIIGSDWLELIIVIVIVVSVAAECASVWSEWSRACVSGSGISAAIHV